MTYRQRCCVSFTWEPFNEKCMDLIRVLCREISFRITATSPGDHCVKALIHWGRVTHICVSKLTIIGSDNGLSPGRRQAIIWTNDGILLIWPLGTNFSEILSEIHSFAFTKMHWKMSSAKWRPFCLGLNVLNLHIMWRMHLYWDDGKGLLEWEFTNCLGSLFSPFPELYQLYVNHER